MRAKEFIIEKKHQQVDEILPVIGAAAGAIGRAALAGGGALARGAMSAGSAIGRGAVNAAGAIGRGAVNAAGGVARGIGNAAGGVARGIGNAAGGQQQQQQPAIPKPGGMYNHPTLGQIKVLPPVPGQKGIKLDTTQKLGFPILIDPNDMQS
jgi:hypothetical protein